MVKKAELPQHIVKAAMDLAAEHGWLAVTMHDVAEAAGVSLADVYRHYPSKDAVLAGLGRLVDETVLDRGEIEPDEPARDRLFEVLMSRFDALEPYKAGVVAVLGALRRDPSIGLMQALPLERSMRWMLEAAGMPPRGLIGEIKVRALGAIWLDVLRVWAKDDSPDLAQTMKSLDKRLGQAEQWANTFEHRRRPPNPFRRPSEPETEPAGDDIAAAFDAEAAADGTAREGVAGGDGAGKAGKSGRRVEGGAGP